MFDLLGPPGVSPADLHTITWSIINVEQQEEPATAAGEPPGITMEWGGRKDKFSLLQMDFFSWKPL